MWSIACFYDGFTRISGKQPLYLSSSLLWACLTYIEMSYWHVQFWLKLKAGLNFDDSVWWTVNRIKGFCFKFAMYSLIEVAYREIFICSISRGDIYAPISPLGRHFGNVAPINSEMNSHKPFFYFYLLAMFTYLLTYLQLQSAVSDLLILLLDGLDIEPTFSTKPQLTIYIFPCFLVEFRPTFRLE